MTLTIRFSTDLVIEHHAKYLVICHFKMSSRHTHRHVAVVSDKVKCCVDASMHASIDAVHVQRRGII